ncbi:MAG: lactate utilization protein [Planctomycetes bacterium]|nr:lactate utilization protein [Planctomycetota bacterium]
MNARDTILDSVRGHLGRRANPSRPPAPPPVPLLGRIDFSIRRRIELFVERVETAAATVHQEESPAAVLAAVAAAAGARSVALSDAAEVLALRDEPALAGLSWLTSQADKAELFAADIGVTTAQWGIAETGTIALESRSERSRLASLVPPVHVALLPRSRILCTMGELLKTLDRPLAPAVSLITGPSRTADIELQLVLGVHGPRELHVVLV